MLDSFWFGFYFGKSSAFGRSDKDVQGRNLDDLKMQRLRQKTSS